MGGLKLNKAITLFCAMIFLSCGGYYKKDLPKILGSEKNVKARNIKTIDDGLYRDWWICERYDLTAEDVSTFRNSGMHNKYPVPDSTWLRVDWQKLPVSRKYSEIAIMATHYSSSHRVEKMTTAMKKLVLYGSGYYSFICNNQNIEEVYRGVFFILDEKNNRLFIVDFKH